MSLPDLYSRRNKKLIPEIYEYDDIPLNIRIQLIHIIKEGIGDHYRGGKNLSEQAYEFIVKEMREEKGVFSLTGKFTRTYMEELFLWIQEESQIEHLLDGLELCAHAIINYIAKYSQEYGAAEECEKKIARFNARLREGGIGYQYEGGEIIKVNSQFLHAEIVVPVLMLISDSKFESVEKEYRMAHKYFREGDYEGCLVECAKAFESTLKIIGKERGWKVNENATASALVSAAFSNNFIPNWMQTAFQGLRSLLESSVQTTRNRMGGHGAGVEVRKVSEQLAALQLHQTGALIKFLVDHHNKK